MNNVGGITHNCNLFTLYLHKRALETPTHVDSPLPFLKSTFVSDLNIYTMLKNVIYQIVKMNGCSFQQALRQTLRWFLS